MLRRCAGAGTLQANSDAGQPIQLPRCQSRPPHGLVPWHVCVRGFACSSILNSRRPRVMLWYQHVLFRVRRSFQAPGSSFVRRAMGLARAEMCLIGRHVVEDCEQEWAVTVFSVVSPPPDRHQRLEDGRALRRQHGVQEVAVLSGPLGLIYRVHLLSVSTRSGAMH